MSEKLLIINEKPSASKAFAKALGGTEGTFEGDTYAIVHLYGHIIGNPVPDEAALPKYKKTVGKFSELGGIPWHHEWFDFNKKGLKPNMKDTGMRVLRDMQSYLRQGYIPVIASDIDPSGEGDLLVREVLISLKYDGKTYREYHVDETPKGIRKALSEKKVVTAEDPIYMMAFARSNMDYLTQQLTRVATMTLQQKGYRLPAPVPMGRLKSVILRILGDQDKAIKAYKPSSVFESRYKLGTLVLSRKDMTQFKTKEEWQADGLPAESAVREVKQVRGETIPPKALTLSQLAGIMSKKGMKSKSFLATYQKMYEAGVMSYPRTEDDFISPEQFNEMLPLVDTILNLIGVPSAVFTHRQPRPTHVKEGGSHGAIRPGLTVPTSLESLDEKFGAHAADIYKAASERFLMMFLENTEWVRHLYETTDTPKPFTGAVKIITRQGVVDPDEKQDDVATALPDTSKKAQLYPHELKSHKPHATDPNWLFTQLAKNDVGTGATRVSTVAEMSGNKDTFPIREAKVLSLTPMGWVGYHAAQGTKIGSVEGTRYLTQLVKDVKDGKDLNEAYDEFTEVIRNDVDVIKGAQIDLDGLGIEKSAPKTIVEGVWNGEEIKFNGIFMGHTYTQEEIDDLLAGKTISFRGTSKKGTEMTVKGKLAKQTYKGRPFIGLDPEYEFDGYVSGTWQGKSVSFKGQFMDHTFTPEEQQALLAGETIKFETHKSDKTYQISGNLADREYKGKTYMGQFNPSFGDNASGTWKGRQVQIRKEFMKHTFTADELKDLFADKVITFRGTTKAGKEMDVSGKLEETEYKGKTAVRFTADFNNKTKATPKEGYATGVWKGDSVRFKDNFMKHTFTDSEIERLLKGEKITFPGISSGGSQTSVTGGLARQEYKGRKYVGFKAEFDNKADKGL